MDFIDNILAMLRGKDEPEEGPSEAAKASAVAGAQSLTNPGYIAYKREAVASGEPVMSPEEYKQFQAGT